MVASHAKILQQHNRETGTAVTVPLLVQELVLVSFMYAYVRILFNIYPRTKDISWVE